MNNKTNIEEDITNVNFLIRDLKAENYNKTLINSLENILADRERLLEENKKNKDALEILNKMKQSIDKLRNREGESMLMVDVCIQNIIAFYDEWEKIK